MTDTEPKDDEMTEEEGERIVAEQNRKWAAGEDAERAKELGLAPNNDAVERVARALMDEARVVAGEIGGALPTDEEVNATDLDFMRRLARAAIAALSNKDNEVTEGKLALEAEIAALKAGVEASYREGYYEGGRQTRYGVDDDWRTSDARTALTKHGQEE